MNKLLAFDTSLSACSIALNHQGKILQHYEEASRQHNQIILPMLDTLLKTAETNLQQINAFALSCGPGSFTGVRIANSVVQGLAQVYDKPIVAISSLRTLAQGIYRHYQHSQIAVIINAHMGELYCGQFVLDEAGIMQAKREEILIKPDIDIEIDSGWVGVGDGWSLLLDQRKKNYPRPYRLYIDFLPQAYDVATLAVSDLLQEKNVYNAADISPVYLRQADAWL